jgi:hypothetical protein
MATQCHSQLKLSFQPKIVVDFNGGRITSDAGLCYCAGPEGQVFTGC